MKLVIDNSNKFYDSLTQTYIDDDELGFPYMLIDIEGNTALYCFKTIKEAEIYQMGMGLRATTIIENILTFEDI